MTRCTAGGGLRSTKNGRWLASTKNGSARMRKPLCRRAPTEAGAGYDRLVRRTVALVPFLLLASLLSSGVARGVAAGSRCDVWAAPGGSDTNVGTRAAPYLTLGKLAMSLRAGQTGCLPPGSVFAVRELVTAVGSAKARVTIRTATGGPPALLADGLETTQATRYLTLTRLRFAARGDSRVDIPGTVVLRGYSTALTDSIVGPGSFKGAGRSCVVLDHAGSARVQGNVLHDCAGAAATLYGAGVLAAISSGARIVANVIFGNSGGDGVALSPNAQFSLVRRNLVVANLGGIYVGGDAKTAARGNRVEYNVLMRNSRFDIHSAYARNGPAGARNIVQRNCLSSPQARSAAGTGFTMRDNQHTSLHVRWAHGRPHVVTPNRCHFSSVADTSISVDQILFG